ncbi:MAG: CPBP family intramembrane metalloprotease [Anaerolineaceae bacterium]|nr:CPBP family intramembrane metalloprotease [Anaerolineaceae bacterium]
MRNSQVRTNTQNAIGVAPVVIITSMLAIGLAEFALAWGGALVSGGMHALILLGYINAFAFLNDYPHRKVFLLLALVPLLRLISLTVPIPILPPITWYLLVGAPVWLVVALINRVIPLSWERLRLRRRQFLGELAIAVTGIPVSLAAYLVIRPKALAPTLDWGFLLVGGLILSLFSGLLEEVIFRGLLPQALRPVFGNAEGMLSPLLYASLYISSQSGYYVVLAGLTGLLYHLWVRRSGTIWGAAVSHSLWLTGLVLVWPVVLHL